MKKLVNRSKNIVGRLEESRATTFSVILSVCAITLLRNLLEGFATGQDNHWWQALTYSPFYLSLFAWMALVLSLFTGSAPVKVIKALAFFWILILLPPLLDLILSGPGGVRMRYLAITGWMSFLKNLITVGAYDNGISAGQRTEIIIACLLCFVYVLIKRRNTVLALAGGLASYLVIFLFGNMIQLFNAIFMALGLSFGDNMGELAMMYYLVALPALFALCLKQNPGTTIRLLRDSRPLRIVHYIIMFVFGTVLYGRQHQLHFSNILLLQYLMVVLAIFFAGQYSVVVNNSHDLPADRLNSPGRPLPSGAVAPGHYKYYGWACLLLALYGAIIAGQQVLTAIGMALGLYQAYSAPPFRFKRLPVLSKWVIATVSLTMALLGFCLPGGALTAFPGKFSIWILAAFTLGSQYLDLKDVSGDARAGIKTLPVLTGKRFAQFISAALLCLCIAWGWFLLPQSSRTNTLLILMLTTVALISWLCIRKKFREWPVFIIYQLALIVFMVVLCTG